MNRFSINCIPLFLALLIFASCNETELKKASSEEFFTKLEASQTGLDFTNNISESTNLNNLNWPYIFQGGGVSIGDINNDGLQDVFFTGNMSFDELYLNKGNFQFENISEAAGIKGGYEWSFGSTMADVNGDGFLDIYVCKNGWALEPGNKRNLLFINNGNNSFTEMAKQFGLDNDGYSFQATFFDYDRDNDLDMYLINQPNSLRSERRKYRVNEAPYIDQNTSDRLFRNNGNNTFTDVSDQAGIKNFAYGLNVVASDINDDGWPDIYISNDYEKPDFLYINNRNGTFIDQIKIATKHISNFGMGCDVADYNNDLLIDIAVVDMSAPDHYRSKTNMGAMRPEVFWHFISKGFHYQYMVNTLQLNNGNMTFSEVAQFSGVSKTDWSWGILFGDLDNDSNKDLLITNGIVKDIRNSDFLGSIRSQALAQGGSAQFSVEKLLEMAPSNPVSNYIFRNNGDLTFEDKTKEWNFNFPGFTQGIAYADLDNDGDLDLITNNSNEPAGVFRNNSFTGSSNHYLRLKLSGLKGNSNALGSKVVVTTGDIIQVQELTLTRGYLSSVEPLLHFGLGGATKVDRLVITWPDGKETLLRGIEADQILEVKHASGKSITKKPDTNNTFFKELAASSLGLDFTHSENEYDDFEKEILLPHKMSENGPPQASGDVNGDNLDDLYIGGAKGQSGMLYIQKPDGSFSKAASQPWSNDKESEDTGAILFDANGDGQKDLYVVSGGNEFDELSPLLKDRLYLNNGNGQFRKAPTSLPDIFESGQSVSSNDYDKDGDLDLFVGGRLVPGNYPFPPNSYLLDNNNGVFTDATQERAADMQKVGMVTGSDFSDIDGDGDDDLLISGEWMNPTIFTNENGRFSKFSGGADLENSVGWWFSIKADDLDGDGDKDIIVGNLGLNSKYKASDKKPFVLFGSDFDKNGTTDIVLANSEEGKLYPVRGKECSSEQMPFISEKYPTFQEFALANVEDIFTVESLNNALTFKATELASCYFLNDGKGNFTKVRFPARVQFAPVNSIQTIDINEDGKKDILMAGNLYGAEVETVRHDAGIGLCLINSGERNFEILNLNKSGFYASGNVKSISIVKRSNDYLLVVGNNNSSLQAFSSIAEGGVLGLNK